MNIQQNIRNSNIMYGSDTPDITSVYHTNTYAPGIATYGIRGIQGKTGSNGSSVFFTDLLFTNKFHDICAKIASKRAVLSWKDYTYQRPYQNGDMFIDKYGRIYILTNINKLLIDNKNNKLKTYDVYFKELGVISDQIDAALPSYKTLTDQTGLRRQRLTISNVETDENSDALLSLISKSDNNNVTDFIDLNAIYNGIPDINFSIYYDGNTNAFHIDSSYPICIDAPVSVKYDANNIKSDIYSPIQIQENSITTFISYCKDIKVSIDSSIFEYIKKTDINDENKKDKVPTKYYGVIYKLKFKSVSETTVNEIFNNIDTNISNIMIHLQNGSFQDFQCLRDGVTEYQFKQEFDFVTFNDAVQNIYFYELPNIQISLIYNIEVFLKIADTNMSDIDFGTHKQTE